MNEPISPDGANVSISVSGLTSTNLQAAISEIFTAIGHINVGSGYTSGVVVDEVGTLDIAMGKIAAGTNINGLTLTQLLKTAFGTAST